LVCDLGKIVTIYRGTAIPGQIMRKSDNETVSLALDVS
jgi:hypothetical protein